MIKLLLVEDDANLRYIVQSSLEDLIGGYEVKVAENGWEGLEAWKEMSATTKRCAFNEWKNDLQRNGDISENLRCRACFD